MGAGTQTTGVILCSQPPALDVLARGGRKPESAPAAIVHEVLAKVATLLERAKPALRFTDWQQRTAGTCNGLLTRSA